MLGIMLPALVAALLLLSLHAYLGIHIIARGVIFVDLAIAQPIGINGDGHPIIWVNRGSINARDIHESYVFVPLTKIET